MYIVSGETANLRFVFLDGRDTFIPDASSVTYTIRDNAGSPIVGYVDLPVTTGPTTVSITVAVPGALNEITGKLERRTVTVKATKGGKYWSQTQGYFISQWLNTWVTPKDVRDYLGVNEDELPDDDLNLVTAYLAVEAELGSSILVTALASSTIDTVKANNAIMYRMAQDVLPGLAYRIAQTETNGTLAFTRLAKLDLDKLVAETAKRYGEIISELGGALTADRTWVMFSTDPDPFTGS